MHEDLAFVVSVQFFVYALAWTCVARLDAKHRIESGCWSGYNFCQAISIALMTRAVSQGAPLFEMLGLTLALAGYVLPNAGVDRFLHQRFRYKWVWLGISVAVMAVAVNPFGWLSELSVKILSLNGCAVSFALAGVFLFWRPLHSEFGIAGLAALLPSLIYALVLGVKTAIALGGSSGYVQPGASRLGLYLFVLVIAGAVNMTFLGLYVSRLLANIRRVAGTDQLTALMNRHETTKHLELEWARYQRGGQHLSVAFLDVDHFKRINDLGGHKFGDEVLKSVASAMQAELRASDRIGRWGGEEFLVILPGTKTTGAAALLERLHGFLNRHPVKVPGGCAPLTVSVGIAGTDQNNPASTAAELVAQADGAMYQAKAMGRNRSVIRDDSIRD